jgi:hypothetical protein
VASGRNGESEPSRRVRLRGFLRLIYNPLHESDPAHCVATAVLSCFIRLPAYRGRLLHQVWILSACAKWAEDGSLYGAARHSLASPRQLETTLLPCGALGLLY